MARSINTIMMTGALMMTVLMMSLMTVRADATEEKSLIDTIARELTDISWMGEVDKNVLQNFITWYKLQLQTAANVLNPKGWNLDLVMPSISGVISLYIGPIIALALILFVFSTLTTFAVGLFNNPTFRSSAGSGWSATLDALTYVVQHALDSQY